MRNALAALFAVVCALVGPAALADSVPSPAAAGSSGDCGALVGGSCPGHLEGDQARGDFHGLIMVPGQPSVLDTAARSGTKPGCGDCTWTVILACGRNDLGDSGDQAPCVGAAGSPTCPHGNLLFRIYLSTDVDINRFVDTICLGPAGTHDIVPVGDKAATDVQQYLKDVDPPLLALHLAPPNGIPAGMPAYFWVRAPSDLQPVPFGGGQITENITIKPERYDWRWGDGQSSGWITDAGAPYPDGTLTHIYDRARRYDGRLTTEWGGTYTITVAGQTFGPYDAVGTVQKSQLFTTTVLSAHSTLVSQG